MMGGIATVEDKTMPDRHASTATSLTSPAVDGFAITPGDATDLPETTRGLYVGTGGTVVARLASGVTLTFANVPSGSIVPVRVDRVLSTGTTASAMLGLV